MQNHLPSSSHNERTMRVADALADLRDSWVQLALALKDLMTEDESPRRDEVLTEVERYLTRLKESER